jgi:hypothetical protein
MARKGEVMTTRYARLLRWAPRVLGIALCLFLGMFALDAFEEGKAWWRSIPDFLLHLIPSFLVLAFVAISWRREWIGGYGFLGLALAYAVLVRFRVDWVLTISGPLLVVGLLFLWSWRARQQLRMGASL